MRLVKAWWLLGCAFALIGVAYGYQAPFREYPSVEYGVPGLPSDYQEKTEFAFARMMFPGDGMMAIAGDSTAIGAGKVAVDTGLSAGGPRILASRSALDANPYALGRTVREPGRPRRSL